MRTGGTPISGNPNFCVVKWYMVTFYGAIEPTKHVEIYQRQGYNGAIWGFSKSGGYLQIIYFRLGCSIPSILRYSPHVWKTECSQPKLYKYTRCLSNECEPSFTSLNNDPSYSSLFPLSTRNSQIHWMNHGRSTGKHTELCPRYQIINMFTWLVV